MRGIEVRTYASVAVTMALVLVATSGAALADDKVSRVNLPAGFMDGGSILLETEDSPWLGAKTIYEPWTNDSGFTYTATNHVTGEITTWTTSHDGEFKAVLADGTGYAYVGNKHWRSSDAGANWTADASRTATRLYLLSLPLAEVFPWELKTLTSKAVNGSRSYFTGIASQTKETVTFAPHSDTLSSGELRFNGRPVTSASTTCPLTRNGTRKGQVCSLTINGQLAVTLTVRALGIQAIDIGNVEKKFTRTDISKYLGRPLTGDPRKDKGIERERATLRTQFFKIAAGLWKTPVEAQSAIGVRGGLYSRWFDSWGTSEASLNSSRTYYAKTGWPIGTVSIAAARDTDDLFRGSRLAANGLITSSGRTFIERFGADPFAEPNPTFIRESNSWTVCRVGIGAHYAECGMSYVSKKVAIRLLNTLSR